MSLRFSSCLASLLCAAGVMFASGVSAQAASAASTGQAASASADAVEEAVAKRFGELFTELEVTGARRTPYGIYEVQIGSDLIYTDEKVTWVMEGPLIDAATRSDVTRERLDKLGSIAFKDLPLELAVKQVRGNGERQMAIFEDPNCGYCKQLHKTLENEDNITIYSFLFPILSPDSTTKSRDVWCAKDPAQVWQDWMIDGKKPPTAQCDAPIDEVLALGKKLMVRGTPAIFFQNGGRLNGAAPIEMIRSQLGK